MYNKFTQSRKRKQKDVNDSVQKGSKFIARKTLVKILVAAVLMLVAMVIMVILISE